MFVFKLHTSPVTMDAPLYLMPVFPQTFHTRISSSVMLFVTSCTVFIAIHVININDKLCHNTFANGITQMVKRSGMFELYMDFKMQLYYKLCIFLQMCDLERRLEDVQEENKSLRKQLAEACSELEEVRSQLADAQKQYAGANTYIEDLRSQLDNKTHNLVEAQKTKPVPKPVPSVDAAVQVEQGKIVTSFRYNNNNII